MNVEELRDFCLSLPQVQENSPWTEPQYRNLITFTIGGNGSAFLTLIKNS